MGIWGLGDEQLRRESYLYSVKIPIRGFRGGRGENQFLP